MKLARYHEENLGHFGLATEMYAHFTSPIRRYPDLVVHRALRALRAETRRAAGVLPPGELPEMGLHLSEMERRAADAERELVEWKKVRFMADKLGETFSGYVTGVQAFGLFVELEEIYVQGLVHVSSMTDDYYRFDEKAHLLKGENTGKVYRLGDKVEVQVARVDLERRQIDFALVDVRERAKGAKPGRERSSLRGGRADVGPGDEPGSRRDAAHFGEASDSGLINSTPGVPMAREASLPPVSRSPKMAEARSVSLNLSSQGADLPAEGHAPGVPLHHRRGAAGPAAPAGQAAGSFFDQERAGSS